MKQQCIKNTDDNNLSIDPTRRRFVTGLAVGGAVSTLGLSACTSIPPSSGTPLNKTSIPYRNKEIKFRIMPLKSSCCLEFAHGVC